MLLKISTKYIRSYYNPVPQLATLYKRQMTTSITQGLPPSDIPIFTTLAEYRKWRNAARTVGHTVGFVPTMGALHDGHLSLGEPSHLHITASHRRLTPVRKSCAANARTVLSIFVNPAQFAPHEDLATYPRTLARDLELLASVVEPHAAAVFLPSVREMYPSGITQDVAAQTGAFVEVKGFGHQMEGSARPTFFRGVATVVTKLFNAVEVRFHACPCTSG
jgi:pantoate--beta-alanine ligase